MLSNFLHLVGYLKYPSALIAIIFIVKGGLPFREALNAGKSIRAAPGLEDLGVGLMFVGLLTALHSLSDPDRDSAIELGAIEGPIIILLFLISIAITITGVLCLVVGLGISHPLTMGLMACGVCLLGGVREYLTRNDLDW